MKEVLDKVTPLVHLLVNTIARGLLRGRWEGGGDESV